MGFLDSFGGDGLSVVSGGLSRPSAHRRHSSRTHSHKKKRSRSRSRSRSSSRHRRRSDHASAGGGLASFFGMDSSYSKNNASRGSFFNLGGKHNASKGSLFNLGNERNSSKSSFFGFSA